MRYTDIAIIGGGLAGSTAAAMLGRAGISTVLIDPHATYPADFRVEKLSGHTQIERFARTGIADSVLRHATFAGENWIARFGRLLDKAPSRQFNILYDGLVNAIDFFRSSPAHPYPDNAACANAYPTAVAPYNPAWDAEYKTRSTAAPTSATKQCVIDFPATMESPQPFELIVTPEPKS